MKKSYVLAVVVALVVGLAALTLGRPAVAEPQTVDFKATLDGYHETPAISTTGTGTFTAKLSHDGSTLEYELTYSGLETNTLFAHIHLGQPSVAGGVSAFLCGGGGKPACPNTEGTVTGTVSAADVIGPIPQGISAGEFDELLKAMRSGVTYANVHTVSHPGGEIRGDINR
jgi:hypothetical protein